MNKESFKVLIIGDVIGKPGRGFLNKYINAIKTKNNIDFIIANGENCAGGFGITQKIADHLFELGVDVITSGNHIWKNKDIFNFINDTKNVLRPLNYPDQSYGDGYNIFEKNGLKILVVNLLGRINLLEVDCPFHKIDALFKKLDRNDYDISVIDFHAETTSEKVALGWYLDGKASAVVGTHTHVQTADERILPKGTAYITDVGMTGSFDSVLGVDKDKIISHFLTRMPIKFKIATDNIGMNSVLIEFNKTAKKVLKIERLNIYDKLLIYNDFKKN